MIRPIDYKQIDPKYSSYPYSNKDENTNIGRAGCGIVCSAMVIASLANKRITPIQTAEWALAKGYKYTGGGTGYTYFQNHLPLYNIKCRRLNMTNLREKTVPGVHKEALDYLKSGCWLIACMGPGNWTKGGHYILVYAYENGKVYINDPASYKQERLVSTWELLKSQVKYYWVVSMPAINERFTKENATDYQIKWLQEKLGVTVDGKWGPKTAEAVKNFREKLNWSVGNGYTCTENMIKKLSKQ